MLPLAFEQQLQVGALFLLPLFGKIFVMNIIKSALSTKKEDAPLEHPFYVVYMERVYRYV